MNWVDYVLLVIVALSGIHGLRLGAAMQVLDLRRPPARASSSARCSLPRWPRSAHGGTAKALVAFIVLIGVATFVGGLGRLLGARSGRLLQRLRLGPVDSVFGVAVAVAVALIVTWVVATILLQNSQYSGLDRSLQQSRIVRALDAVLPPIPTVFAGVERFLAQNGFPIVFAGLPPQTAAPVTLAHRRRRRGPRCCGPRDPRSRSPGRDAASSRKARASWWRRGSSSPTRTSWRGSRRPTSSTPTVATPRRWPCSTPVSTSPCCGSAGSPIRRLPVGSTVVARGTTGVVLGYPGGGPLTARKAGVAAAFEAVGLDIYGSSQTTREIYQLDAVVQPGNSGGPLVASGDPGAGRRDRHRRGVRPLDRQRRRGLRAGHAGGQRRCRPGPGRATGRWAPAAASS